VTLSEDDGIRSVKKACGITHAMQCRSSRLNADEPGVAGLSYADLGGLKRTPHARFSQPPSPRLATASTRVAGCRLPACIQ